jgi:dTDP-4-amino-4,6-dideoxygalactose transaminase
MLNSIPLYEVNEIIGDEVIDDVRNVIESGWLTLGEETEQFEVEFATSHDTGYGVAMNSCTSALYAAIRSLEITATDRVAVPAITFSATANIVRLLGADVVLVDVDETGNMDPESLERVLSNHDISAVIPVHLYGNPCDMDEITGIVDDHDVPIVEDCAHAPGATLEGNPVGSFGEVGCFSFYATKNMTTGEGGMAITDSKEIDDKLRKLRNHHQTKSPDEKQDAWGYDVDGLGFNFRMSEIEATIGRSQLEKLPAMNESRRDVARRYVDALEDIGGLRWVGEDDDRKEHVFHLFVIEVSEEYPLTRNGLYDQLAERDIITGVHYPSISELSYYADINGEYEYAEELSSRILSLPMFPNMDPKTQDRVIDALRV